jgi:hypothetical protein
MDSGIQSPASETDGVDSGRDAEEAVAIDAAEAAGGPRLRPEFHRFAEWVFGPQGIGSLQLLAVGDFAYSGRIRSLQEETLILCRNTGDGSMSNFRINPVDGSEAEVLHEYRDALEACPVGPFLGY